MVQGYREVHEELALSEANESMLSYTMQSALWEPGMLAELRKVRHAAWRAHGAHGAHGAASCAWSRSACMGVKRWGPELS